MMNQNDEHDAELSVALTGLTSPAVPNSLQQRVRGRIRANMVQQQALVGIRAAMLLIVLALVFQVWLNYGKQTQRPTDLSSAELDFLFAPPPVDSLAVLDRQQQIAYRTLQRWEPNR